MASIARVHEILCNFNLRRDKIAYLVVVCYAVSSTVWLSIVRLTTSCQKMTPKSTLKQDNILEFHKLRMESQWSTSVHHAMVCPYHYPEFYAYLLFA